jgi:hypothetical protein
MEICYLIAGHCRAPTEKARSHLCVLLAPQIPSFGAEIIWMVEYTLVMIGEVVTA